MRHDLAIVVASALLVMGSQTRVAADTGSLSQGSQDSHIQPRVQVDMATPDAVTSNSSYDMRVLAAGMSSDPSISTKVDKKHKDKKDHKDNDHRKDGDHKKDKDTNPPPDPSGWDPGDGGNGGGDLSSPTPEPGTLLLTGLVAASAGVRARRRRKSP